MESNNEWIGNARQLRVSSGDGPIYDADVISTHREDAIIFMTIRIDPQTVDMEQAYERAMRSSSVEGSLASPNAQLLAPTEES